MKTGELKRIACVIPAYNEARTIAETAARAHRYCGWVIVVDDGSVDGTADRLAGLPVTLLHNPATAGKAESILRGARFAIEAGAESIITIDGDGQHHPEEIPRLISAAKRSPGRIVLAARLVGRSTAPALRRFANRFADFWISWAAGYPVGDTQSGFRLYPAELFTYARPYYGLRDSFVFESEILIDAAQRGCYTVSLTVEAVYSPNGRASHYRPIADTLQITRMVAWKLFKRGLNPIGLLRSLKLVPHPAMRKPKPIPLEADDHGQGKT